MKKQFEDEVNKQETAAETLSKEATGQSAGEIRAEENSENYYDHIRRVREEQNAPKKRNRKKELLIIAGALAAAAILLFATRGFTEELKWQKVESTAHQYYNGASSVITSGTELKVDGEGAVVSKNENEAIADLPIYYDDRDALLLTETSIYYDPRSDSETQVEPLTEFSIRNGNVYAAKGDREKRVDKGFIYNGKDKYIFLEPVTIAVNEISFDLPALSYIEADAYGNVSIFNYETKETENIKAAGEAEAYPEGKAYTLQMISDSIIGPSKVRMLLFFAPERLSKLLDSKK